MQATESKTKKSRKKLYIILSVTAVLVAAIVIAAAVYALDYYRADAAAKESMSFAETDGKYSVFDGKGNVGLVFYPGGKVEYSAYAPLMKALADDGITCVLVKMPLNLAVFGSGAFDGAKELAPEVEHWYIGGHSLGGAMAASVANDNGFDGLILLGAYAADEVEIPTLSIYGTLDGVLNREKYAAGFEYYVGGLEETVIEGGNHAQFGSYGKQDGDGDALVSSDTQLQITKNAISAFTGQ